LKYNKFATKAVHAGLTLLGIKTLHVRWDRINQNAVKVAEYLEAHPKIDHVNYPGLKSFPRTSWLNVRWMDPAA